MSEQRILDGEVKYVPVYASFYKVIRKMNDEELLAMYDAICQLGFFGHQADFSESEIEFPSEHTEDIFSLIRPNIEVTIKKMRAGKRGGRPKKDETNG